MSPGAAMLLDDLDRMRARAATVPTFVRRGRVRRIVGLRVEVTGLDLPVGALCSVEGSDDGRMLEVVGFEDDRALCMALGSMDGIERGDAVRVESPVPEIPAGPELLGRVMDGLGRPLDRLGPIVAASVPLERSAPSPLDRPRIHEPLPTGVRAIDAMTTVGAGQRMGIFAGSGVGKSMLLGMIARFNRADVTVIALVGERGREVREFLERDLGEEGRARSVVVVATNDAPPTARVRAALAATAVAESFREAGKSVLLLMDSVTRVAYAQREIGLAAGEPPATKGYPPSVYSLLARLLERGGRSDRGSITGVYTVLVEGDEVDEPIADAVRAILDGHVWLSRDLAHRGQYPAVDILGSVSRVMIDVVDETHREKAAEVRELLAAYRDAEDLIQIGAYAKGSNPRVDRAIAHIDAIRGFLRQRFDERVEWDDTIARLGDLLPAGEGEE